MSISLSPIRRLNRTGKTTHHGEVIMKKVIAGVFISLDGVVENPQDWHFPYFNDEMGDAVGATLGRADTVLFGRVTYDSFAGAWPARARAGEADADLARARGYAPP